MDFFGPLVDKSIETGPVPSEGVAPGVLNWSNLLLVVRGI